MEDILADLQSQAWESCLQQGRQCHETNLNVLRALHCLGSSFHKLINEALHEDNKTKQNPSILTKKKQNETDFKTK